MGKSLAILSFQYKDRLISHITEDTSVSWTVTELYVCSQRESYPRHGCLHFLYAKDYGYEAMRASDWLVGGPVSLGACFQRMCMCASKTAHVHVCVCIHVWGRKRVLLPTWKLMLLSVGGRLFLVAAWWAGTHGDISAFFPFLCESEKAMI